jgi:hypothetical protein
MIASEHSQDGPETTCLEAVVSNARCTLYLPHVFFAFLSVSTLQFFLTDGDSSRQIICSIFKVSVSSSSVFGLGFDSVEWHY